MKAATGLYVKSGGAWKSLLNEPTFTGENVDATSSEYTSVFPNPPPPSPPGFGSCLSINSLIMLFDGTYKKVQDIVIGDKLKTLNGIIGTVIEIEKPILTTARRMMRMYHADGTYLRMSDDHDMWVKENSEEQWGTYNYNWWLYEAKLAETLNIPALPLEPMRDYEFATTYGWNKTRCEWELQQDPNEVIYNIIIDQGGGFIADGFVVISEYCSNEDIENVKWQGLTQSD